jgi:hypothetical protein
METKKLAHSAGYLYLLIIVCGLFSEGYVRLNLLVPGDSAQTAQNIMGSNLLFRFAFVSDLFMVVADVGVAIIFYILLKPVSELVSLLAAFFRLAQAAVIAMNLLNHLSPLLLVGTASKVSWTPEQLNDLILFFMESHKNGYLISQVFFSFNCAAMGFLLFKSSLFPNWLGVGIALASAVYFIDAIVHFLAPLLVVYVSVLLLIPIVVELSLCLWLIVKGVRRTSNAAV